MEIQTVPLGYTRKIHRQSRQATFLFPSVQVKKTLTVRMPDTAPEKLHRRWTQRIILGEFQFGRKHATLERRTLGTLDESFPMVHVIFGDGTSRDPVGGIR